MRLYRKVPCTRCERYPKCPQRIRMLVNYCGSRRKDIADEIDEAVSECRARRGLVFKRDTRSIPSVWGMPAMPI
jgi:hypothetical protein